MAPLAFFVCCLLSSAAAFHVGAAARPLVVGRTPSPAASASDPPPPAGFEWADASSPAAAEAAVVAPATAAAAPATATPAASETTEAYYCTTEGCWVGTPPEDALPPSVKLPDGREFSPKVGVESHDSVTAKEKGAEKSAKRKPAPQGIFAPAVLATKQVMGTKELNQFRAQVIAEHTKVISAFVDTSESPFGQLVLRRMFEAADKDGNGSLDREEVREALHALGFKFIEKKQLDKIMDRADEDDNDVIDFEEFVKETPKTLRVSLVKLAKQNGHDLGFLA